MFAWDTIGLAANALWLSVVLPARRSAKPRPLRPSWWRKHSSCRPSRAGAQDGDRRQAGALGGGAELLARVREPYRLNLDFPHGPRLRPSSHRRPSSRRDHGGWRSAQFFARRSWAPPFLRRGFPPRGSSAQRASATGVIGSRRRPGGRRPIVGADRGARAMRPGDPGRDFVPPPATSLSSARHGDILRLEILVAAQAVIATIGDALFLRW